MPASRRLAEPPGQFRAPLPQFGRLQRGERQPVRLDVPAAIGGH